MVKHKDNEMKEPKGKEEKDPMPMKQSGMPIHPIEHTKHSGRRHMPHLKP
jgi:hypothetical protein